MNDFFICIDCDRPAVDWPNRERCRSCRRRYSGRKEPEELPPEAFAPEYLDSSLGGFLDEEETRAWSPAQKRLAVVEADA